MEDQWSLPLLRRELSSCGHHSFFGIAGCFSRRVQAVGESLGPNPDFVQIFGRPNSACCSCFCSCSGYCYFVGLGCSVSSGCCCCSLAFVKGPSADEMARPSSLRECWCLRRLLRPSCFSSCSYSCFCSCSTGSCSVNFPRCPRLVELVDFGF